MKRSDLTLWKLLTLFNISDRTHEAKYKVYSLTISMEKNYSYTNAIRIKWVDKLIVFLVC